MGGLVLGMFEHIYIKHIYGRRVYIAHVLRRRTEKRDRAQALSYLSTTMVFSVLILSGGAAMCCVTWTCISTLPLRYFRNSGVTLDT